MINEILGINHKIKNKLYYHVTVIQNSTKTLCSMLLTSLLFKILAVLYVFLSNYRCSIVLL